MMLIYVPGGRPVYMGWAVDAHFRATWCDFMICQNLSWVQCGFWSATCSVLLSDYDHGCFRVAE
jgi:hypothetical protein